MAAARRRRLLVPEAEQGMKRLKGKVMTEKGYDIDPNAIDNVKYEVAKEMNILLNKCRNGQLASKQAGKIGGEIGGSMVKEMIKMAKANLNK